jgi:hypothetical protein
LNYLCNDNAKNQDSLLTYGFPNQYSLKPSIKYAHYCDIGTLPILLDIFRCQEIISMKRQTWSKYYCSFLALLPQMILSFKNLLYLRHTYQFQIRQVYELSEEWDHFAEEMSQHYPVIQLRNSKYLRWRFLENPIHKYRLLEARCEKKLEGYLVYIINPWPEREKNNLSCGYIVDFLVPPTSNGSKTLHDLIYRAKTEFINQKAVISTTICNIPHYFSKVFSKSGFWKVPAFFAPRPVHFTIQKHFFETELSQNIGNTVDDLKSWYLTMGDNDII